MCSNIFPHIPIVMITGNHEYNTKDNWNLFTQSYELYGLNTDKISSLTLGNTHLVNFDPYDLLYGVINASDDTLTDKVNK